MMSGAINVALEHAVVAYPVGPPFHARHDLHLGVVQAVILFSGSLSVSEMQDETQMASATSSPGPLAAGLPQDRDIDVLVPLPSSFESYIAW